MKALKITLIAVAVISFLTSCTKQDLNEDDVLIGTEDIRTVPLTGGMIDD
ncbi:hypothetical protein [Aestuariibaculum sediminum]|uniref:Uncharacterized protein n=1 Tax=Aestuariibaculum sediminum TaxID=2770637 RepID=A0A8J6Q192_9FLAO|nr:hypothetical protein [Aestuariibaculum sediminum]MBD0830884.1 hypothetical protein [Aestuariibaculum sediminum]